MALITLGRQPPAVRHRQARPDLDLIPRESKGQRSTRAGSVLGQDAPMVYTEAADGALRWSIDELRATQLTRLQDTVRRVYATVPHYRAAFDAHLASPHFKAFAAATEAMIDAKRVATWQRAAP